MESFDYSLSALLDFLLLCEHDGVDISQSRNYVMTIRTTNVFIWLNEFRFWPI